MAEIGITKVSSKGQIVIPHDLKGDIKEGDKLVVIRNGKQLILKRTIDFDENIEEDLEFAKRTEEAYKRYESGKFKTMEIEDFIKEMKKW